MSALRELEAQLIRAVSASEQVGRLYAEQGRTADDLVEAKRHRDQARGLARALAMVQNSIAAQAVVP